MKNNYLFKSSWLGLTLALLFSTTFIGCKEDDPEPELFADFRYEISDENFLQVTFTDLSDNAEGYSWNFGDGSDINTEQSPVHVYETIGEYSVTLTVSRGSSTDSYTQEVSISDPNEELAKLAGLSSKTWSLVREGTSMLLASDPNYSNIYWSGLQNDGSRPCLYDDTFTFNREGEFIFNDNGSFWAEYGVFNNVAGCDSNTTPEGCFDAIPSNMFNECGDDVSDWLTGTHAYDYDFENGTITLTGNGAWMGIPKLATTGTVLVPQSQTTFNATIVEGGASGVDTLKINFAYDGAFWPITYVSYADGINAPDIISIKANFDVSTDGLTATFSNRTVGAASHSWDFGDGASSDEENPSHTYAAEGTYTVTLTGLDNAGISSSVSKEVSVSSATLSEPAPTPTADASKVIAIYSDAYTAIDGVDMKPNWGQATSASEEVIDGDNLMLYSGLNYQGISFSGNPQDVSGKTHIHIDVWSANAESIQFFLIDTSPAETDYILETEAGKWTSFDIPLSEYSSVVNLEAIKQLKLRDDIGATPTFYIDNIYFYSE